LDSKGRLRGAFTIDEVFDYDKAPRVFGQAYDDSCVAACCKMLLDDEKISEARIRVLVKVVKGKGADLKDVPVALKKLGASVSYHYEVKLSLDELRVATSKGPVMVSVKTSVIGDGSHAIIVDGFPDKMVLIRDPLPEWQGSAYQVTHATFTQAWTRKAVIIDS
jgi:filamentous hemagglutinin